MAEIYRSATEYTANEITIHRGDVNDIVSVGVFHTLDPDEIPDVLDFTEVLLIDGVNNPSHALAQAGKIEVLALIGPKLGSHITLLPGDYQRFVLIQTASEDIIRRPDVLEIL